MFGTLRLLLALLVAISHVGYDRSWGVTAVVVFYLISGFVMTGLVRKYYLGGAAALHFYIDRAARIYPQYLFFLCLTALLLAVSGIESGYVSGQVNAKSVLYNLTIVPLNFFMFNGIDKVTLLPPAWSLGTEVQFYMILPFILINGWTRCFLALSLIIFSFASFQIINIDWYGYRLLPGVLFIFLTGSLLYDYSSGDKTLGRSILGLCLYMSALFLAVAVIRGAGLPANKEVFIGFLLGATVVLYLSSFKRKLLDEVMGNISYGVFLSHCLVLFFAQRYGLFDPKASPVMYLSSAIVLGVVGFYAVERPFVQFRRQFRLAKVGPEISQMSKDT